MNRKEQHQQKKLLWWLTTEINGCVVVASLLVLIWHHTKLHYIPNQKLQPCNKFIVFIIGLLPVKYLFHILSNSELSCAKMYLLNSRDETLSHSLPSSLLPVHPINYLSVTQRATMNRNEWISALRKLASSGCVSDLVFAYGDSSICHVESYWSPVIFVGRPN